MSLYRDQGVVLRTVKLGETDRIVTIFTQSHGKIRAVAKGIRRPGSRFGARLEPTTHVAFQCYEGRELDVVTQAETIDSNRKLREHYGCLTHAVAMLEAVDQASPDRERNTAMYRMLAGALRELGERPSPLVAPAFFWKLLSLEGFHPHLDGCVRCGADDSSWTTFERSEGGLLCDDCGRLGGVAVRAETVACLRLMLGGELARVLADPPEVEVVAEVERLALGALEYHLERRLRSAALL